MRPPLYDQGDMDDTQRAAELRRMERLATGLLVAVTILFVVASLFRELGPWVGFVRARGEELKQELLSHPMLRQVAGSLWQDMKLGLLTQCATPGSPLRGSIAQGLAHLGDVLETDAEWRTRVDGWAEDLARYAVRRYGRSAGEFVTQTVRGWEASDITRKIELQFGRDLQYIRINGTLVGGLAGLVIYSVSLLL